MGKQRTAAYCRVSTLQEEQDGSYDIQMKHYRDRIENDPDMELVGIYGDKGKSGTKITGRIGLQELLKDCEAGKVDLILTKSISRFARNMADCIEMIRKFRELNVTVYFEKENMSSTDMRCELFLNIFAALAQEESNSISQNVRRSHVQYAMEGRPLGVTPYGYVKKGEKKWQVIPEEAKYVKKAFYMAAEGKSYTCIHRELNRMAKIENTGVRWYRERIRIMLQHEAYKGDYYSHKTVALTIGKGVKNKGYRDRYYIEEHHEAIVSEKVFDRVQLLIREGLLLYYKKLTPEKKLILQDESWREEE